MSVLLLIDFHKLRCPVNHSHSYLYYFGVSKGVKSFGKQLYTKRNNDVYSKSAIKENRVDK